MPPRWLEKIVEILTPPAYREVLLGDLRERYRSVLHYISDAWFAIPWVICSRAKRVCDPGVIVMDAILLYICFWLAAWQLDPSMLYSRFGLLKLAIPVPMALAALMLSDVYARPGQRSPLRPLMRGTLAAAMAWISGSAFTLPWLTLAAGCGFGVIAIAAVDMVFPPNDPRPRPH
jgi:hypothetical protein